MGVDISKFRGKSLVWATVITMPLNTLINPFLFVFSTKNYCCQDYVRKRMKNKVLTSESMFKVGHYNLTG